MSAQLQVISHNHAACMGNNADYEKALRDAVDNISVVAVRYAVGTPPLSRRYSAAGLL
jgi:hypothetical protein